MRILVITYTMIVPRQHSMRVGPTVKGYSVLISIFFIFDSDKNRLNLLTPNVNNSVRTAPLTSKVTFYIFIQQI